MWRSSHPADLGARAARAVTIVATVLFALLLCRWRPWALFEQGPYSSDFYDEQARSFLRLRLAVRPEVASIEGFLIDGRTYLYFGPLLALVRVPFAVFGDLFAGRLTRVSMITGYASLCTASFHLVRTRLRPWRVAGFVAAVACSPALYLASAATVYHETELWAATFATWTAVGVLRTLDEPTRRNALLASLAVAATILTRAPVGIGMAAGAGLLALHLWWRARPATGRAPGRTAAGVLLAGCTVGIGLHLIVNTARFGSPLALPAERQVLTLANPARAAWFAGNHGSFFGARFLPTTVAQYLRPDTVSFERLVPFVRFGRPAADLGSYPVESATPAASLTASATLLVVAAVIGAALVIRHRAWRWAVLAGGASIAAVPTFLIGFIANRYLVDMLPALMIPAAFAFRELVIDDRRATVAARTALVALVAWGTWCNVALATWTQNLREPGFTEMRYAVDGRVFGDPAPSLERYDPARPVPRDGVVALAIEGGRCEGVYIADQGRWAMLERTDGRRQLTGTLDLGASPDADTVDTVDVVGTDAWIIRAERTPAGTVFVLDVDGVLTRGDPIASTTGPISIQVAADEITAELSVRIDGEPVLLDYGVPPGEMMPYASFRPDAPGPLGDGSLCRRLERRR